MIKLKVVLLLCFFYVLLYVHEVKCFTRNWSLQPSTALLSRRPSSVSNTLQQPPNSHIQPKRWCTMQLLPISKNILYDILPRRVNTEQWKSYWGTNPFEKLQKAMESLLVAYGGAWLAWFVSFMSGGPLAAIVGTGMIFNWIFSPYVISRRNNQRFWFDQKGRAMHHAIFIAKIVSIKKIRRRRPGKSLSGLASEFLDIIIKDEEDKELEIICPWRDEYSKLRLEMTMQMVLASKDKTFTIVKAVSDAYVPSCKVWIGDYPYLDKREFKLLMRQIMKSKVAPSSLLRDESEDVLASQRRSQRKVRRSQNGSSGSVLSSPDVTYRLPPPRDSNTRRSRVDQDDEDDFRYDDRLDEEDAFDQ